MSEQEMLVLSTKDRDRLKVLHEVRQGHLTQRQAGEQLGLTDRWVRRLLVRVKKEGDRGVVHGLRGRVSNRRLPEKVRRQALKLVQAQYRDFGPTLAFRSEGVTRGEAGTFNAATGGRAARAHRSLGEEVARPGEEGRRPGRGAWAARAGVEPTPAGEGPPPGAEAGAGAVPRLWAHAGLPIGRCYTR